MKKTLATVALCVMAIPLVACGPTASTPNSDGNSTTTATTSTPDSNATSSNSTDNSTTDSNAAGSNVSTTTTNSTGSGSAPSNTSSGGNGGSSVSTTGGSGSSSSGSSSGSTGGGTVASSSTAFANLHAKGLSSTVFVSSTTGFVAGNDGIYETSDGGKTWKHVYTTSTPVLGIDAKYQPMGHWINTVAYTKSYLLTSVDGLHFKKTSFESNANIEDATELADAGIWVLDNGAVWASGGLDGRISKTSLTVKASSIAAVDDNTCYAATTDAVYKTTDHGQHWTKVFTPAIKSLAWKTQVEANGLHAAVMYYGGDAGMSQVAYILFDSNNGGQTWTPMTSEGYFASDYNNVKPINSTDAGEQPGPFALLANGDLVLTGFDIKNGSVTAETTISADGKTLSHTTVGKAGANAFDFPGSPLAIAATDSSHIWVVGSKGGKGALEMSVDGSHWSP